MALSPIISGKRVQISKANAAMLTVVIVASIVTVFSIVGSFALFDQQSYQSEIITEKTKARDQLLKNIEEVEELLASYKVFVESPENIISGSSTSNTARGGDNAKIILDALPSTYDFPALTASVEKMLRNGGVAINSISGVDDELAHQDVEGQTNPSPIEMPFEFSVSANYETVKQLIDDIDRSIRPFHITQLTISGEQNDIELLLKAKTYYQPGKSLTIDTRVIR
ncbi:MAG: hypothetical protein U5K77_01270 [Candidatus Saccharibacteria bacterium]|nr:hypothetical protein [Candidatus Saccharibacteria bacterium]